MWWKAAAAVLGLLIALALPAGPVGAAITEREYILILLEANGITPTRADSLDAVLGAEVGRGVSGITGYDLSRSRRTVELEPRMITAYETHGNYAALLEGPARIRVPVGRADGTVGEAVFDEDGTLLGISDGEPAGAQVPDDGELAARIDRYVYEASIVRFAYSGRYGVTFVYARGSRGEFLIPYAADPAAIGLDNGRVYPADEAVRAMAALNDESADPVPTGPDPAGKPRGRDPWGGVLLCLGVTAAGAGAAAAAGVSRRRRRGAERTG